VTWLRGERVFLTAGFILSARREATALTASQESFGPSSFRLTTVPVYIIRNNLKTAGSLPEFIIKVCAKRPEAPCSMGGCAVREPTP
jgi:hypothetical protein